MDTDEEGDNNDWDRSLESDMLETEGSITNRVTSISHKVILHFDLDCFYAQVEMIRNPALRTKPLGIQQKYIIVTCNYVAREQGVTKLMSVTDAVEKCPQLVLVKGEDLTNYREISYKVTDLLMSYCPLVERLGFDENYMDVTEIVERRLKETRISDLSFSGHIYKHECVAVDEENARLAVGSVIAAEMRQAIFSVLGLTGCAGIASNKLLAKLVSGTFKPNQQTTLLPYSTAELMSSLTGLIRVPGIGYKTREKLKALGLVSVRDLQLFPLPDLVKEFGEGTAKRIQNLACGIDESPVTSAGPPQSLSDEDSFKKISTQEEVVKKTEELLTSLTERMHKDGRQPHTFRLTIRRYTVTNRWFSRESRQCPIPKHTGLKITCGNSEAVPQLLSLSVKLFHKMVDTREPFHLTLLNVCFSNLQAKSSSKSSIASFFTQKSPTTTQMTSQRQVEPYLCESVANSQFTQADVLHKEDKTWNSIKPIEHTLISPAQVSQTQPTSINPICPMQPVFEHSRVTNMNIRESCMSDVPEETLCSKLPPGVDPEVFKLLPGHIQMELITGFQNKDYAELIYGSADTSFEDDPADHSTLTFNQPRTPERCESALNYHRNSASHNHELDKTLSSAQSTMELHSGLIKDTESHDIPPTTQAPQSDIPANVDPYVFSQLPADVQRELLTEWKQQKPVLKIPSKHSHKTSDTKDKKNAAKGSQCNNILKYFKPN
ncbi:DNA polymerase iota [Rhinichthys klamathensis goyatoka]|uniref:DNA polymerase iota n=1 Tax=Rhinichthys klamathensis goyatoka TaxID=3034132 RepID=UPI0024B5E5EC|nr:DNA polymerase iota [Rhinichthys klamathensis goyatoka]